MNGLTERYADRIAGVIECPDRVVIMGTLPTACYTGGMPRFLTARKVGKTYKYDLTKLGQLAITAALTVRDAIVRPTRAQPATC